MGNKLVVTCVGTVTASEEFYEMSEAFIHVLDIVGTVYHLVIRRASRK